ncbi:lytic murein transglycosylase B [Aestuariibacter halophilus]|uniref:Lytic murein transglycosylase B n=1 Tax=Fluctibacter halophilus TaxID=226011 RepID=A0ABS8G6W2_9ALTE|nr:lytic murein transglycosylase B [Aestuariibacter halophilus]MCC2615816.1 lytic murein transglycosylase B [Aestuariibacter halophilus]
MLTVAASFSVFAGASSDIERSKQAFVDELVNQHGFTQQQVSDILATANKSQPILEAIARPWEAKPWHQYYPIFLTEKRLNRGLAFMQQHAQALQRAEKETGVPAHIITAIIGIETFYGSYTGKHSVLDALYTLGFYYPPRASFFRKELAEFFLLSREEQFDMNAVKGSYAGAMGWGQFISSSYRHYAVDFDHDGKRDLLTNPVDAIGSVANYFKQHGWRSGQPVAFAVEVNNLQGLDINTDLKYQTTWADLAKAGLTVPHGLTLSADMPAKVFPFEQQNSTEHWVGLHNFYVITRYNHSPLYAMAVYQFSQQLRDAAEQH